MRKVIVAVLLLVASVPMWAQGTYTQIDYPGAIHTYCYGINAKGDTSGSYSDGSIWHGFLLSGGSYTTVDFPGASATFVYGLNDKGRLVGYASKNGHRFTGFVYDPQSGRFHGINYPGALSTAVTSIDDSGTVAGWFNDESGIPQGFKRVNSVYSQIVPPGDVGAYVRGMSSRTGELVGLGEHSDGSGTNFSEYQGTFQQLTIPGYPSVQVYGINPAGTALVGFYNPAPWTYSGFLYEDDTLQEILPTDSAQQTVASGINASGQVVGLFIGADGIEHGFIWTPPADPARK